MTKRDTARCSERRHVDLHAQFSPTRIPSVRARRSEAITPRRGEMIPANVHEYLDASTLTLANLSCVSRISIKSDTLSSIILKPFLGCASSCCMACDVVSGVAGLVAGVEVLVPVLPPLLELLL